MTRIGVEEETEIFFYNLDIDEKIIISDNNNMDTPPTKRSIQNFETARWERESKKWAGRKLYEIDYLMEVKKW